MTDSAPDATPAPPWRDDMGIPEPDSRTWPPGKQPELRIRVDGRWRRATVIGRQDWPDGRIRYQCEIWLPDPAARGACTARTRAYWWDPRTMRLPGRRAQPETWRIVGDRHGGVLHRGDCDIPGGGTVDEAQARIAMREERVRACEECRPEREMG
jgi:hypothetical protein